MEREEGGEKGGEEEGEEGGGARVEYLRLVRFFTGGGNLFSFGSLGGGSGGPIGRII